jgi:hypothetical protein
MNIVINFNTIKNSLVGLEYVNSAVVASGLIVTSNHDSKILNTNFCIKKIKINHLEQYQKQFE